MDILSGGSMTLTKKLSFYAIILGISLSFMPILQAGGSVSATPTAIAKQAAVAVADPMKRTWLGDIAVKRPVAFLAASAAIGLGFLATTVACNYLLEKWYPKEKKAENVVSTGALGLHATGITAFVACCSTWFLGCMGTVFGACEPDSPLYYGNMVGRK